VCLHRDGRVERLAERRRELRLPTDSAVSLERLEEIREARLLDLSTHGAQIELQSGALHIGERLLLCGAREGPALQARVMRNGRPGNYGLLFEAPAAAAAGAEETAAPLS
jgi:hypothetical protein